MNIFLSLTGISQPNLKMAPYQHHGFKHFVFLIGLACAAVRSQVIPDASEISISWLNQPVRALPMVQNFFGSSNMVNNGAGLGPITMGGFNGNLVNSTIAIQGYDFNTIETCEWTAYEGTRHLINNDNEDIKVKGTVRMPIDERIIIQRWDVSSSSSSSSSSSMVSIHMDGPFFRSCDEANKSNSGSCGWGLSLPVDKQNFVHDITTSSASSSTMATTQDTLTDAASAMLFHLSNECDSKTSSIILSTSGNDVYGFDINLVCNFVDPTTTNFTIFEVITIANTTDSAQVMMNSYSDATAVENAFDQSYADWNKRWVQGFTPNNDHFSGHLPTVESNMKELDKLYFWSSLAQLSLERTSMLSYERQYVISEGASNSYDGSADMGGSGNQTQFK
jgi:hypothetical protein